MLPICLCAQENSSFTQGYISLDGKMLQIIDSFVRENILQQRLEVYLFPFKLSDEEIKFLRDSNHPYLVVLPKERPSPNEELWERCPRVIMYISFDDMSHLSAEGISNTLLSINGFQEVNHGDNMSYGQGVASDCFSEFTVKASGGTEFLILATSNPNNSLPENKSDYFKCKKIEEFQKKMRKKYPKLKDKYSWDIRINKKILRIKNKGSS